MSAPHEVNPRIPPPINDETPEELINMLSARPYKAFDPYITRLRDGQAARVGEIDAIRDMGARMEMMRGFLNMGKEVWIVNRFFCEYGFNVHIGDEVFIGANCTMLDICPTPNLTYIHLSTMLPLVTVTIGTRSMLGPNVSLYTAEHPIDPKKRNGLKGAEWARPITIGDDCWIGGSVVILAGVTIGNGCTIGAGSVVTRSIPDRSVVVGNPGKVVKRILEDGTLEPVTRD